MESLKDLVREEAILNLRRFERHFSRMGCGEDDRAGAPRKIVIDVTVPLIEEYSLHLTGVRLLEDRAGAGSQSCISHFGCQFGSCGLVHFARFASVNQQ